MIYMNVALTEDGVLRGVTLSGHFVNSEACAALSSLARTVANTLDKREGVEIEGSADRPGDFSLKVISLPEKEEEWARGVTSFFMHGVQSLKRDMGRELDLSVQGELI
jgi:uncharacterized protein YsxB (DUF464 family)